MLKQTVPKLCTFRRSFTDVTTVGAQANCYRCYLNRVITYICYLSTVLCCIKFNFVRTVRNFSPNKTTPLCQSLVLKMTSDRTGWFQARCGGQVCSISGQQGLGKNWEKERGGGAGVGRGKDVCKLPQGHTGVTVRNSSQCAAASTWCVREREGCSPS